MNANVGTFILSDTHSVNDGLFPVIFLTSVGKKFGLLCQRDAVSPKYG